MEFDRNDGDSAHPAFVYVTDFYDSVYAYVGGARDFNLSYHGFSYINFADVDSDNDLDLFWGDIFNLNVYFFRNDGTPDSSDLTRITDDFLPFTTTGFNHTVFADLDGDGDQDMLLGIAQVADLNNLRYLRNEGTAQSPSFVEITQNYISQIDIGTDSHPTFGDLDNDGDQDMLVGGSSGRLAYYRNVGGVFAPSFDNVTGFFGGIDVGGYSAPVLVDWDNDGDLDLLIGNVLGRIEYWRNVGNASNFVAVRDTNQLAGIKVDQLAIPMPVDLNGDNLTDLIVGEWDFNGFANVLLYQNAGTVGNPILVLVTKQLLKREVRDFTVPFIYDWNDDGQKDLILGGRYVGLTLFTNNASTGVFPDSTTFVKSSEILPGGDAGQYLSTTLIDIDNDGDDDVFEGEESGGINFYRQNSSSCCVGNRGDIDSDGSRATVSDLTYLINDIFRGGPDPVCPAAADLDNNGQPSTVIDLTYLIDNIFRGGPAPPACP